jgi:hypothetical protein
MMPKYDTRAKWMDQWSGQLIGNFMLGMAYNPAQSLNLISNNYVESSVEIFGPITVSCCALLDFYVQSWRSGSVPFCSDLDQDFRDPIRIRILM